MTNFKDKKDMKNMKLLHTLSLCALLLMGAFTSSVWGNYTTTLELCGDNKSTLSKTENRATFSIGGNNQTGGGLANYNYITSGKTATLSWSVVDGYTLRVSQIQLEADRYWSSNSKSRLKYYTTKSDTKYELLSDGWTTVTLSGNTYFPLGKDSCAYLYADGGEYDYRNIEFTYTVTANTYTVSFNGNGSTKDTVASIGATYDQNVTLPANRYRKHQYIVTYDVDGGSAISPDSTLYTFLGWNKKADGTGTNYSAGQTLTTPNFTSTQGDTYPLYAKWSATVASTSITLPAAPTKAGYNFDGWYIGETRIGGAGGSFTPSSDTTITARWSSKYTPVFNFTGSKTSLKVDEVLPNAFSFEHVVDSAASYRVISISAINNGSGKVIEYDKKTNSITAINAGQAKIVIDQSLNDTIFAGHSDSVTITVTKNVTSFSGSDYKELLVDGTQIANYSYTNVSAANPTASSDDDFFYTIDEISYTNSAKNKKYNSLDSLVRFNPNNKQITALNAGTGKITFYQAETYKYTGDTVSFDVEVSKHLTTLDGFVAEMLVDATPQISSYSVSNTSAANPSEGTSNDFYYTITNTTLHTPTVVTGCADGHASDVIGYTPGSHTITAYNAGTAKLTIAQKETYKYTGDTLELNATVSKHVPVFTWKAGPYYYNDTLAHFFKSSQTATAITVTNRDPEIALLSDSSLITYNVAGTARITVSQAENYYWAGNTEYRDITPVWKSNHVTLDVTESNYTSVIENHYAGGADRFRWLNKGVLLGSKDVGLSEAEGWDSRYIDIHFTGMPDSLSFTYEKSVSTASGMDWWVKEKSETGEWSSTIWTADNGSGTCKVALKKDTRWVRLRGYCNYGVYFKNIKITKKEYFKTDSTSLDFATNVKNANVASQSFKFKHANAGYTVTAASSDDTHYKVSLNNSTFSSSVVIPNTGGDKMDSSVIYVKYYPNLSGDSEETHDAQIVIGDLLGDTARVNVTGTTQAKLATRLVYLGDESYDVDHANIAATTLFEVRDANDALVSSPVITLTSSDYAKIDTVNGNTAIDFLCGGSARITASYAGDDTYAAADNIDTLITVNKLNDTVTWNRLDTTDHLYHVWAGGSTLPSSLASVHSTSGVTYTTGDATKLYVDGSGNLRSAKKGRVRLTASSTGDCNYDTISCDTIVVVEPCYHSIVWDQNFLGFVTASDGTISEVVDLTAYAVDSLGSRTYIPVHYWLSTDSIGSISGSRLTLNHYGEAKIAAITAEHDTFATVTDTLTIRIRKYGTPCESYALNVSAQYHFNPSLGSDDYCEFEITAPADSLSCQVHKLASGTITTKNAWLQGWSKLANDWVSLKQIYKEVDNKSWTNLGYKFTEEQSTDITKIRYYNPTETYSKYVRNQLITQKRYFRANKTRINRGSGNEVKVNTFYSDTIEVSFSDVPLINYRYTGNYLTLTPQQEVNNDCGDYDTYKFVLSGRFPKTQAERTDTIYFTTSALDTIRIPVTMQVVFNGTYILPVSTEGTWSVINQQWRQGGDVAVTKPDGASEISVRGTLIIDTIAEVQHVDLVTGGKIIIKPGAGLTVGANGIAGATTSSLILEAGDGTGGTIKGKTGYLRISPTYADTMPNITIELYSKAYYDRSGSGDNVAAWQCVGAPISDAGVAAKSVYTNSWIYSWDEEKDDWVNNRKTLTFTPFVGYITTQYKNDNGMKLTYEGRVVSGRESRVINLAYSGEGKGHNLLANSYAAPIDISRFSPDDFYRATPTIYIQNAGTKTQSEAQMGGTSAEKAAAPGQYLAIPVNTAASLASTYGYPIMIPAMQGFWVDATGDDATLTLDYERLVWNANYATHSNAPMRAPKQMSEQIGSLQISMEADGWYDNIFMLESENYETVYEEGSDALKKESGNLNIFTLSSDDRQLSIDATNSIIGTRVGVRTGEETAYTFTFSHVQGEQEWSLLDMETEQMIDITDGNTYTFFAEPNTTISGRFMIVESDSAQKPAVTTGLDNAETETKVHKFVKDNNLYILKSGIIYDAMGARVR